MLAAAALAFFAYLGFEDLVHLSEEVRDPRRSFPRALLGGLAVVGVLYTGVTVSVALLVEPTALAASSAPLLDALEAGSLPVPATAFAFIAIVAVTNTALLALTTASRQIYGLAEKGSVPAVLGRVGRRRHLHVSDRQHARLTGTAGSPYPDCRAVRQSPLWATEPSRRPTT